MLFKKRSLWGPAQLPFLRQISSSHLGEHPLFLPPAETWSSQPRLSLLARTTGEGHLRSQSNQPGLSGQHPTEANFMLGFLTPSDTVTLKMVENCQVQPQLWAVRLHSSRVFISQRCPDVARLPQGPPMCAEKRKKLSLDKTQWGHFDSVTSPIPQTEAGMKLHLFLLLFYFMEVTAFAETRLDLQISHVKWHNCPPNTPVCTGWAPAFTTWMR